MRNGWTIVAALVVGTLMATTGVTHAADSAADTTVGPDGERADWATETNACDGTEGGGGILAVNEAYYDDMLVTCWPEINPCKTCGQEPGKVYALNVGDVWAGYSGGAFQNHPDTYYDSGECGWADYVGVIPRTTGGYQNRLYFYTGEASVRISGSTDLFGVAVYFDVQEYSTTNCTSPPIRSWWDNQYNYVIAADDAAFFRDLADYGIGDCTNVDYYESESTFHMPDLYIYPPNDPGYRSYLVVIWTKVKNWYTGVQTDWVYDDGCFYVWWS